MGLPQNTQDRAGSRLPVSGPASSSAAAEGATPATALPVAPATPPPAYPAGSSLFFARAVLFFLALAGLFLAASRLLLPHTHAATALTPGDALRNTVVAVAAALLALALALQEHRNPLDYGFRGRHPLRNLIGGGLSGTALLSALILLLHQLDLLVFRGQVLYGVSLQWRLALEWLALSALAAFAAEILVHGYLQYALTRAIAGALHRRHSVAESLAIGFWTAALTGSGAFALLYRFTFPAGRTGGALSLVNAVLFTLLMAFSLWRTGSLWWAWGFHLAWDWTESFLWGVPLAGVRAPVHLFYTESTGSILRSGGDAGPTGSLYTLGALLAGFGILMLLHKARVYPELWDPAPAPAPAPASESATGMARVTATEPS